MRYTAVAVAAALTLLSVATSVEGQREPGAVDPRSLALLDRGRAAEARGALDEATDLIETSVAVDPRNRAAFVALGRIAGARGLPGKAIRRYREALALDPNDVDALAGQGEALVARGAVGRAKDNLARLRTVCARRACPEVAALTVSIAKGPPVVTAAVNPPAKAGKE